MELHYSKQPKNEAKAVKAMARDQDVSFKSAVVVADQLRGMPLNKAFALLEEVISLKKPIAYRKFTKGVGHRKGNWVRKPSKLH